MHDGDLDAAPPAAAIFTTAIACDTKTSGAGLAPLGLLVLVACRRRRP
ncbi:hypothetical protein OV090_14130 [Nannocystis sp. RBIL2]|nr:MYXO-CTERM sorting domain-containing protein [Nannocystis sp. RBIL2]MCY1065915.1 hypothetical protein [Nannocystis sp. RBIL2]